MKYLNFDVKNMAITKSTNDKSPFISGAVDYFGIHFNFDEEFATIPGAKAVEFIKKNNKDRRDLVDGKCAVPNWVLVDKEQFQMRVISGNTIGTPWQNVAITEGGLIMPEEPEEELPATTEYVKTFTGDEAVPYLREATNGLEYSKDGVNWNNGLDGIPEVPKTKEKMLYARANKDWVRIDQILEELQEAVESATGTNAIIEVKVDGTALTPVDGAVDINLSAYAKTTDVAATYATQQSVNDLQTLTGTSSQLTALDYEETDTATIVAKINEIVSVLQLRGIATE